LLFENFKKSGGSQAKLAELAGLTQAQISSYLRGEYPPSLESLDGLAKAFGVSVAELLKSDVPPKPRIEQIGLTDEISMAVEKGLLTAMIQLKTSPAPEDDVKRRVDEIYAQLSPEGREHLVEEMELILEGDKEAHAQDKSRDSG
jgi:transcriptional regulator with XRE-family HTH domain